MITGDILKSISAKLGGIVWHMIIVGLLFFILAMAILFYPQILQVLFVVAFFIVSFSAFLIAVKVKNIKDTFERVVFLAPRKEKAKK